VRKRANFLVAGGKIERATVIFVKNNTARERVCADDLREKLVYVRYAVLFCYLAPRAKSTHLGIYEDAVHIEYNGGLSADAGGYDDAYLGGAAWNWANKDFTRTFSVQLLYKYMARQAKGNRHSWQLTTVWGIHFAKGLCSFIGYADLWQDKRVNGSLVLSSEPQFWVNLNALKRVDDQFNLSVGSELRISNNLVWPTTGTNNRFYAIPTLALKWTF
jgi:hypothetical protein